MFKDRWLAKKLLNIVWVLLGFCCQVKEEEKNEFDAFTKKNLLCSRKFCTLYFHKVKKLTKKVTSDR